MNERWQEVADSGCDFCSDSSWTCCLSEASSLLRKASVLGIVISVIGWQQPRVNQSSPALRKLHLLANNPEEQGWILLRTEEPVQSCVKSSSAFTERVIKHTYQPFGWAQSPFLLTSLERTPSVCREAMQTQQVLFLLHAWLLRRLTTSTNLSSNRRKWSPACWFLLFCSGLLLHLQSWSPALLWGDLFEISKVFYAFS